VAEITKAIEALTATIGWAQLALKEIESLQQQAELSEEEVSPEVDPVSTMAWGAKVSPEFRERVKWIADNLGCSANHLMACMAWESGESFRSDIRNGAGSGATGLIQFMPTTARSLGTTTAALAKMRPEDQLNYVYKYFQPYAGRLRNLGDIYMAILWPKGVGQPDHYVLFNRSKAPTTFRQNAGLDVNKDGLVTRAECLVKINEKLAKGLLVHNVA
jgi:hypothetical protein